ncbi:MAG: hypothetical protein GKS00_28575 [Alphaproteobacteria bacterium]|nr:hypothetical protein [Alphaproteobacteria bacterium]
MKAAVAERLLLESEKSPALTNVFRVIADAEADGVPKFSPGLCRDLARTVVCRVYAPPLLELCHLIRAADACAGGYASFFWGSGPARPAAFRSYVERNLSTASDVRATRAGLELSYPDGGFVVTYSRMPFLSAMMEFLVTSIGYVAVDDIVAAVRAPDASASVASQAAKSLASAAYAYLKENLLSAQNQRKFRRMIAFLSATGDAAPEAVGDDAVMAFWLAESAGDDGADFKTFRSAFTAFLRFMQAMTAAQDQDALENTKVLGTDWMAGEVEPGDRGVGLEVIEEAENPLDLLAQPPSDAIRFLTKAEARTLDLLVQGDGLSERLPLSVLRCEVFGAAQARITQGLRRRLDAASFTALIDSSVSQDYHECRTGYGSLADHVERVLLASFHVLAEAGRAEAMTILLGLRPSLDYSPLAAHFLATDDYADNVEPLSRHGVTARFMTVIATTENLTAPLRTFVAEAKSAFGGISRRGFRDKDLRDETVADGFAVGGKPLFAIREHLGAFDCRLARFDKSEAGWDSLFEADRAVFLRQFHLLYGADT